MIHVYVRGPPFYNGAKPKLLLINGIDEEIVRKFVSTLSKTQIDPRSTHSYEPPFEEGIFPTLSRSGYRFGSFPFNGGTTNVDCLFMNKPFVTLSGDSLHSRLGRNLLMQMELPELIAEKKNEYVEIAVRLAENPSDIQTL